MTQFHQLNNKWSLWYDDYRNNSLSKEYNKNLFLISSFESIEVFIFLVGILGNSRSQS